MAATFIVFGTLIALNFGFGTLLSESMPRAKVEIENVEASGSVPPAVEGVVVGQNP